MAMRPILLAEDSADDQTLILRSLKKNNITNPVLIANDGVEALDYLFATGTRAGEAPVRPAVVLLDMKMPRLGGLDVLESIRKNPASKHIPVVILTSSDEEQDKLRSYDLGANSYVRKPIDFSEFAEAVSNLGLYWALVNEPPPDLDVK